MISLSSEAAAKIAEIDAPLVSSDPEKYVNLNVFQYKVLIKTWMGIIQSIRGPRQANALLTKIKMEGLLHTISQCSELANAIIQSNFQLNDLGDLGFLMVEDPRLVLQMLRYPKRFSPFKADLLAEKGIESFIETNLAARGTPVRIAYSKGWKKTASGWKLETGPVLEWDIEYPDWLISSVKSYLEGIYPTRRKTPFTQAELFRKGYFSSGTTAEGCKTLVDKLSAYAISCPYYGDIMYPCMVNPGGIPGYICIDAVPKDYRKPRIIGEVPAYFQYHLQGARTYMEEARAKSKYKNCIILDDQSFNQEMAFVGSVDGSVATVDLSSASDSIARPLAQKVFPHVWFDAIERNNPDTFLMPDMRQIRRWMWQSSGNATTFEAESGLFLAIALSATEYVELFTGEKMIPPRVYGDDLVCDTRVFQTLSEFLTILGFKVNLDKSFAVGSTYRESCGVEYWCGLDTATKYWPRKGLNGKSPECWAAVISLQHRLFEFEEVDIYLSNLVFDRCKDLFNIEMTSSLPGTECDDLWSIVPKYKQLTAPYDKDKGLPNIPSVNYEREGHYALTSSYPKKLSEAQKAERSNKVGTLMGWESQLHMYLYTQWLIHGPSFSSSGIILNVGGEQRLLDEVLGVRTPKESFMRSLAKGQMRWEIVPR